MTKPNVPCAACGKLMWPGPGLLPVGQATCKPCRRARRPPERRVCPACSTEFTARASKVQNCCSRPCARLVRFGRKDRLRSCAICGVSFAPSPGGRTADQKTCGRACGAVLQASRPRASRPSVIAIPAPNVVLASLVVCALCRRLSVGRDGRKYCSARCQERARKERARTAWDRADRTCPHCSQDFAPTFAGQAYCTSECQKRARRSRERVAGTRSSDIHRHRARKYGRAYERIKPHEIFERDGWICQLCSKRVPKTRVAPHPLSPTLDHIIPMSLPGGDHVRANVQLAHFICNSRKGDRVGTVQLALIG